MGESGMCRLLDLARAQADINARLKAGNTFGEIGERIAAEITGAARAPGPGRDLRADVPGWSRPADPVGLAVPGPVRRRYADAAAGWDSRRLRRYQRWLGDPARIGEVK